MEQSLHTSTTRSQDEHKAETSRYNTRSKKHQLLLTLESVDEIMKQDAPFEVSRSSKTCWRCQITKKQCDGKIHCRACKKHTDQYWDEVGCQYDELEEDILHGIPDFVGLGNEEWLLPASDDLALKVYMQYADSDIKIYDLEVQTSWSDTPAIKMEDIISFIEQFHNLHERWPHTYEDFTTDLIHTCADIQIEVLTNLTAGQEMLSDGCLLICYSLRLLAFAHEVFEIGLNLPVIGDREYFEKTCIVPQVLGEEDKNPSKKIHTFIPGTHDIPEDDQTKQPKVMLQVIFQMIHKLLLRGRPSDKPAIFSTFCLLHLIRDNFDLDLALPDYACDMDPFDNLLLRYTSLYLATAGGGSHPLSGDWNDRKWRELVGENHWAAPLFEEFSDMWNDLEGSEDMILELDLHERIDRLCLG